MPEPPFRGLGNERRPVDINVMKRNMTIAKGFLDISLLSANANQLRNIMSFGNESTTVHHLILAGITLSIILQVFRWLFQSTWLPVYVSAGVVLVVAERFDINKEDEQHRGDLLNTVVISLIFVVLVINVFVASLGVDLANPYEDEQPTKGYDPAPTDYKGIVG